MYTHGCSIKKGQVKYYTACPTTYLCNYSLLIQTVNDYINGLKRETFVTEKHKTAVLYRMLLVDYLQTLLDLFNRRISRLALKRMMSGSMV